jgi:hypothetical protein
MLLDLAKLPFRLTQPRFEHGSPGPLPQGCRALLRGSLTTALFVPPACTDPQTG